MNAWNDAFSGAQPTRPAHAGSVRSRTEVGSSSAASAIGVVSQHSGPAGHSNPAAFGITEALVDAVEQLGWKSREAPFVGKQPECACVLGEKQTGRGILAFFKDRRRELSGAAIAGIDRGSGLLSVLFDEWTDEGFVSP